MDKIRYYTQVFKKLLEIAIKEGMQSKLDTFFYVIFALGEIIFYLLFINIIFTRTNSIASWTRADVFLLFGVVSLVQDTFYLFCGESLWQLQWKIWGGTVDYVLLLPIDSQFMGSFRYLNVGNVTSLLISLGIFIYALHLLSFNPIQLGLLLFSMIFSIITWYSLYLIMTTISFYMGYPSIVAFERPLSELSRAPLSVFGRTIRVISFTILPVAFVAFIPASIFLGKLSVIYIFIEILVSILVFYISRAFWKYSLKKYVSVG